MSQDMKFPCFIYAGFKTSPVVDPAAPILAPENGDGNWLGVVYSQEEYDYLQARVQEQDLVKTYAQEEVLRLEELAKEDELEYRFGACPCCGSGSASEAEDYCPNCALGLCSDCGGENLPTGHVVDNSAFEDPFSEE